MVVAAVARTAYASPLEPLWSVPYKGSCDATMFASNGGLVLARGKELVAVDAKTGKQGPPRALAAKIDPARAALVAGMVIAAADDGLRAYDATTGAAAWSSLTPAIAAFTKDAVLVAGTSDIRLVDARTGSARWTVALESGPSVAANVDEARAYVATQAPGGDAVVTAYSLADGKTAWTMHASSMYTGHKAAIDAVAAGEGIVLAEIAGEGMLGLDAATGKQQWGIRGALGAFVVRDGRLFAGPGDITAYDAKTGAELWSSNFNDERVDFAVDDAGVIAALTKGDELRALDPATGKDLATPWGIAGQRVIYQRDDHASPMVVVCGAGRLAALDPTGTPVASEHATIDGSVPCRGCAGLFTLPNEATVHGAAVPLVHGGFHTAVEARGRIRITSLPAEWFAEMNPGDRTFTKCDQELQLSGRGKYKVTCPIVAKRVKAE